MGFVRLLGFREIVGRAFWKFLFFCSFVFLLACFDVYFGKSKGSLSEQVVPMMILKLCDDGLGLIVRKIATLVGFQSYSSQSP